MNQHVMVAATICGLAFGASADAIWKAATDGAWETGSNWSTEAVPLATESAQITPSDASYTVTLDSQQTVKGLTVAGKTSPSYQTKLNITGFLRLDGGKLAASYCDINIGEGGVLEIANTSANTTIAQGARLVVDGGTFSMTEGNSGYFSLGSSTWVSGGYPMFVLNDGYANFMGSSDLFVASPTGYSTTELNGGVMELRDTSSNRNAGLMSLGANSDAGVVFTMKGDAKLWFSQGGSLTIGRGVSTIGGNATLEITSPKDSNTLTFGPGPSDSNRKTSMTISDNATITAPGLKQFVFGKNDLRTVGTRSTLTMTGGSMELGYRSNFGVGTGLYDMRQQGGTIVCRRYGAQIGGVPCNFSNPTHANASDMCCTSTVTIAGGTFECRAENSHGNTPNKSMLGLVVGGGLVGTTYSHLKNGWTEAYLNIEGEGVVTNGPCAKIVGVGKAFAKITQTGGVFSGDAAPQTYNEDRDALVLGAFGGEGVYELSGGTASLDCPLYVGGTSLGLLQRSDENGELPADTEGQAKGTLAISGNGTMSISRNAVVGRDGSGTIELSDNASLTIGKSLSLTNAVTGSAAKIKIKMNATTAPTLSVGQKLVIDPTAELVVDATDFTGSTSVKLIDCASRIGSFTDSNITILGNTDSDLRVNQTPQGDIYLMRTKPLCILFK